MITLHALYCTTRQQYWWKRTGYAAPSARHGGRKTRRTSDNAGRHRHRHGTDLSAVSRSPSPSHPSSSSSSSPSKAASSPDSSDPADSSITSPSLTDFIEFCVPRVFFFYARARGSSGGGAKRQHSQHMKAASPCAQCTWYIYRNGDRGTRRPAVNMGVALVWFFPGCNGVGANNDKQDTG